MGCVDPERSETVEGMGTLEVFVLGHKEYYPKYGFQPYAARREFTTPYLIPMS